MSQSTSITGAQANSSTAAKIQVTHPAQEGLKPFSGIKWLDNFVGDYEFNRYGIYTIALLVVGCLGGITMAVGGMSSPVAIAIAIVPTMASLTMILAVSPMRLLLWTCITACLIDIAMITYYLVA